MCQLPNLDPNQCKIYKSAKTSAMHLQFVEWRPDQELHNVARFEETLANKSGPTSYEANNKDSEVGPEMPLVWLTKPVTHASASESYPNPGERP